MLDNYTYLNASLKLHLFFARIMKEHAIFLEAAFTPVNSDLAKEADFFKQQFEQILKDITAVSKGIISDDVLRSEELVTEYTLGSEEKTSQFTGITIDTEITEMEANLYHNNMQNPGTDVLSYMQEANQYIAGIIDQIISFKENVLNAVNACTIYMNTYPLNLQHVLDEARYYKQCLAKITAGEDPEDQKNFDAEEFWNDIMREHALFIRGLLDPTEVNAFIDANDFSQAFAILQDRIRTITRADMRTVIQDALAETDKFKKYNDNALKQSSACRLKVMAPLLYEDHLLREANHYVRLLKAL